MQAFRRCLLESLLGIYWPRPILVAVSRLSSVRVGSLRGGEGGRGGQSQRSISTKLDSNPLSHPNSDRSRVIRSLDAFLFDSGHKKSTTRMTEWNFDQCWIPTRAKLVVFIELVWFSEWNEAWNFFFVIVASDTQSLSLYQVHWFSIVASVYNCLRTFSRSAIRQVRVRWAIRTRFLQVVSFEEYVRWR